jgi:phage portal protein BeeE
MNLFTRFKTGFNSFMHPDKLNGSLFYPVNSSFGVEQNILNDFCEIPELNAVINWKARAFSNINLRVVSKTSGEEIENEVSKIIKNPNWFQAQGEFLRQTKLFHDLFGNEYMYLLSPVGMNKVSGWYTLPPQNVEVKVDSTPFWQTTEANVQYIIDWDGKRYVLDNESVIHLNDNRVNTNSENYLTGVSKVKALEQPLRNIRSAYNARGTNLAHNGPMGIITSAARDGMGSMPLSPEEKEIVQNDLRQYGALSNQFKYIVTSQALDFQAISADTEKLQAFEEVREDFDKIMDAYGVTKDIFSSAENSTFENKSEAEKQAYQNTIIPESVEWLDALNKGFKTSEQNYVIAGDYWHLPLFQENEEQKANTLNTLTNTLSTQLADGVITVDEYKEQLNDFYE